MWETTIALENVPKLWNVTYNMQLERQVNSQIKEKNFYPFNRTKNSIKRQNTERKESKEIKIGDKIANKYEQNTKIFQKYSILILNIQVSLKT